MPLNREQLKKLYLDKKYGKKLPDEITRRAMGAIGRTVKKDINSKTKVITPNEALKMRRGKPYKDPKTGTIKYFEKQKRA